MMGANSKSLDNFYIILFVTFTRLHPHYNTMKHGHCNVNVFFTPLTTSNHFRYRRLYKKNACRYMLYTVKASKTYGYIPELQTMILRKRLAGKGMPRQRTLRPNDPRRYGLLPPVPAPTIEELLHTQVRRGLGKYNASLFIFPCGLHATLQVRLRLKYTNYFFYIYNALLSSSIPH